MNIIQNSPVLESRIRDLLSGSTLSSMPLAGAQASALASVAQMLSGGANGLTTSDSPVESATDAANAAVLDFHADLEAFGHQNAALNAPVHALTNLGETIGLGHVGEPGNLLTDTVALAGDPASLPTVVADLQATTQASGQLAAPLVAAIVQEPGLLGHGGLADTAVSLVDGLADGSQGQVHGLLENATSLLAPGGLVGPAGLLAPVTGALNQAVLDLHGTLESLGHDVLPLNGALHGVTELGEAIGLGHLGASGNLVTDVADLSGAILTGHGAEALPQVVQDVAHVVQATTGLVGAVVETVTPSSGGPLGGGLGGIVSGGQSLVDINVGPSTSSPIADVNLLGSGTGQTHLIGLEIGGQGSGGGAPIELNVLSSDSLQLPLVATGGADALKGAALDHVVSAPLTAVQSLPTTILHGLAPIDLGAIDGTHAPAHDSGAGVHAPLHLLGL